MPSTRLNAEITKVAGLDVGAMWDRMLGEFLGQWSQLDRQKLPGAEIAAELQAFMDSLSEAPTEDMARTSAGVVYNQGRMAEMESAGVERVVRSEVLDQATCEVCAQLDGEVYEVGTGEYYENAPPAKCEGGDRCRGFYVPLR